MRKLRLFMVVLLFGLLCTHRPALCAMAQPAQPFPAIIDGVDSDRVHLRVEPSTRSESLGLYFTGTALSCESDPTLEWTRVVIGVQEGYIQSDYLRWGNDRQGVQPRQPKGIVTAKGGVNLRSAPSKKAPIKAKLQEGDDVILLGETSERWSYVKLGNHTGYILSKYLVAQKGIPAQSPLHESRLYYDQYLATFPFKQSSKAFYGIAVIDARADRSVHLREWDDDDSPSFGEYYQGTKVVCVSDPSAPWVSVWIGNMLGNVRSDDLSFDVREAPNPQFAYGEMLEDAILCADPFSDTVSTFAGEGQVKKGQMITLLGRTHNDHYFADTGKGWGYIRCEYVRIVDE